MKLKWTYIYTSTRVYFFIYKDYMHAKIPQYIHILKKRINKIELFFVDKLIKCPT